MLKRWDLNFCLKILKLGSHLSPDGKSFHMCGPHIAKEKIWHWAAHAWLSGSVSFPSDLICLLLGLMTKLLKYLGACWCYIGILDMLFCRWYTPWPWHYGVISCLWTLCHICWYFSQLCMPCFVFSGVDWVGSYHIPREECCSNPTWTGGGLHD